MDLGEYSKLGKRFTIVHNQLLTDEEVKDISLCILDKVDAFCSQHDIKYSLAYGTLLGAVRHKGFIPWDDDIDIIMLRPDYEKFISLFPHNCDDIFSVASFETDKKFHYPFAKVICNATINNELGYNKYGFAIDLFPIDKIPAEENKAMRLLKYQGYLWNAFMLKSMRWDNNRSLIKNLLMCISKGVLFFIPYSRLYSLMRVGTLRYKDLQSYYLGCLYSPYGIKEYMPSSVFDKIQPMVFEKRRYMGLSNYHTYLNLLYGEYMKLPPPEKRISHHNITAIWK